MMPRPELGQVLRGGRSRRIGAALALLLAVGVAVAIVLLAQSSSSPSAAKVSSQTSGTTTVQRRDLVATDTESGTLSYAGPKTVYDRLSGTITWLPSVGQAIEPGQALFKVDGQPVILMNGTTPAYRDLNGNDTPGQDILELNRNLAKLGFNPDGIVVDDVWQPATTAAVEVFQESLGEAPTGDLSLGQVVFLPGEQVVSAVDASLGSDGGGGGGANPSGASGASVVDPPTTEYISLETHPTSTSPPRHKPRPSARRGGSKRNSTKTLEALIALLQAEIAELKAKGSPGKGSSPSSSKPGSGGSGGGGKSSGGGSPSSGGGSPSSGGGNATAILQTASNRLVATVDLDASKQSEAKVGGRVTVEMPAGKTVNGTISAVSPIAQSSSGNGGNGAGSGNGNDNGNGNSSSAATVPVTITLNGHVSGAGLDQAAVSVNFVQSQAHNVLSVPVTALLATAGGGYAVQQAAAPHRLIPVTTGLFAAGYVEIAGPGIYPGLQVTDSQG